MPDTEKKKKKQRQTHSYRSTFSTFEETNEWYSLRESRGTDILNKSFGSQIVTLFLKEAQFLFKIYKEFIFIRENLKIKKMS